MIKLVRTDSTNEDFQELVKALNNYLAGVNGEDHSFFTQFNKTDSIKHVVVAYKDNIAVGCGAIKEYDHDAMEVKRMFVRPEMRGQGIASAVLHELEDWAKELNYKRCVLETAETMQDAVGLYKKSNYIQIPNYGQYEGVETSVCFEKVVG